jgi:hypothetical protein
MPLELNAIATPMKLTLPTRTWDSIKKLAMSSEHDEARTMSAIANIVHRQVPKRYTDQDGIRALYQVEPPGRYRVVDSKTVEIVIGFGDYLEIKKRVGGDVATAMTSALFLDLITAWHRLSHLEQFHHTQITEGIQ